MGPSVTVRCDPIQDEQLVDCHHCQLHINPTFTGNCAHEDWTRVSLVAMCGLTSGVRIYQMFANVF